jgi:hypothetical protein
MASDAALFLTHPIARTDSLATIAVRYGVSIRDVKRANGGMITDATLHARASVRIPRTSLAEGAPLPGGGGLTGALKPKVGSSALEEMREYYGTASAPKSAGTEDAEDATRAFTGGAQTATKLVRGESAPSFASRGEDEAETRGQLKSKHSSPCGVGVSPSTFQSRDRALMSPSPTRAVSGMAAPRALAPVRESGSRNPSNGFPNATNRVVSSAAGFFVRAKQFANEKAERGEGSNESGSGSAAGRKGKGD